MLCVLCYYYNKDFFSFFSKYCLIRRLCIINEINKHFFCEWDPWYSVDPSKTVPANFASCPGFERTPHPRGVCQAFELLLFFLIAFLLPGRSRTFSFHNYFLKHTALRGPRHRSFADAPVRQASRHATEASSCAGARTPSGAHSGGGVRSSSGAAPQHAANQRPTA